MVDLLKPVRVKSEDLARSPNLFGDVIWLFSISQHSLVSHLRFNRMGISNVLGGLGVCLLHQALHRARPLIWVGTNGGAKVVAHLNLGFKSIEIN